MYSRTLAVALAVLGLAGCASQSSLTLITRTAQETPRGTVHKRISRINDGPFGGGLLASNYYYGGQRQAVTPPVLRDLDARARYEGCSGGGTPIRHRSTGEWSHYDSSYVIAAIYECR